MSKVTIGLIQVETRLGDKEYNLALAQENFKDIRFYFTSEF